MRVPDSVREDLSWWTNNVDKFRSPIQRSKPNVIVKSDASKKGWGAECLGTTTGGMCKDKNIQLKSDNSTTVACINNNGSIKPACNDIARDIWLWCLERHNFVSAVHIPGSTNIEADFESREIDMRLNNG